MLKVIFYTKSDKVGKNGDCPIYAKVSLKGKSTTISTGKAISKERWDFTNNLRNVLKLEKEKVLKQSLDLLELEIQRKYNELVRFDPDVSLSLLKGEISGRTKISKNSITIMEIMERHNKHFRKKVGSGERAHASLQKYERAAELLKAFLNKQYRVKDIDASELTSGFVYSLESFLRYESDFNGQAGIKNNSVVKYIKMYKTACNYCIKMDILERNPFNVYQGRLSVKDAVFLSQAELDKVESKEITVERLARVRDIFIFSCYTGYAPVDALGLTPANVVEGSKGQLWIIAARAKTAIRANVPVLPPALAIIKKYKGKQQGILPSISNQKMNAYLKELADICGIDKHLTWYVARHTFATTVTLGNGIRMNTFLQ